MGEREGRSVVDVLAAGRSMAAVRGQGSGGVIDDDIGAMAEDLGVEVEIALGPGGFMGGEESALLAVLESRRAMARCPTR